MIVGSLLLARCEQKELKIDEEVGSPRPLPGDGWTMAGCMDAAGSRENGPWSNTKNADRAKRCSRSWLQQDLLQRLVSLMERKLRLKWLTIT